MDDISKGKETVSVALRLNSSDDFPEAFTYIKHCVGGPGVNLPKEPFYQGCSCQDACSVDCLCTAKYGKAYDVKNDRLTLKDTFLKQTDGYSQPVFECNSQCSCSPTSCSNRVIQSGITVNLEVFPVKPKGWGLRTLDTIQPGQFVCEYAGEIISLSEAKRRTQENQGHHNYIIVIKEHIQNGQILRTHVDPIHKGNAGRFINHSCDPNLIMIPVRSDSLIPTLALFAIKEISPNTELSFDYSGGCAPTKNITGMEDKSLRRDEIKKCYCGAQNCLRSLPFDQTLF